MVETKGTSRSTRKISFNLWCVEKYIAPLGLEPNPWLGYYIEKRYSMIIIELSVFDDVKKMAPCPALVLF